jgi:hypothetical protein
LREAIFRIRGGARVARCGLFIDHAVITNVGSWPKSALYS